MHNMELSPRSSMICTADRNTYRITDVTAFIKCWQLMLKEHIDVIMIHKRSASVLNIYQVRGEPLISRCMVPSVCMHGGDHDLVTIVCT